MAAVGATIVGVGMGAEGVLRQVFLLNSPAQLTFATNQSPEKYSI